MKTIPVITVFLMLVCGAAMPAAAENLSLRIEPGPRWEETTWLFLYRLKHHPQLAAWIETADGRFVRTLVVSDSAARGSWRGNPDGGRPDALPVWSHASRTAGSAGIDAASSATPAAGLDSAWRAEELSPGGRYIIRLEINNSFDYNEFWPKKARQGSESWSGVNGQPSVIYEASFTAGTAGLTQLEPAGQGAVDGSDGRIRPGLHGLTTALQIVSSAVLEQK